MLGQDELSLFLKYHAGVEQVNDQEKTLFDMSVQLEKLCTAEKMLDDNCDADMVVAAVGLKFSDDAGAAPGKNFNPQYWEIIQGRAGSGLNRQQDDLS